MIRVLLADDHAVIREGLRRILHEHQDLKVVGEVVSGEALMAALTAGRVDVLVLDIAMPGPGIFALLERLKAEHPSVRCVVLSVHPADQYAVRVLRAGAAGYLSKEQSPDLLIEAIRKAHAGGIYFGAGLAETLAARAVGSASERESHEVLSNRELEVLVRIGAGLSIKSIAAELRLSPKTVSTYHSRIRHKLRLQSDADLVRYVIEHRLSN